MSNQTIPPPNLNIMVYGLDDEANWRTLIDIALQQCNLPIADNYRIYDDADKMLKEWMDNVHICIVDYDLKEKRTGLDVITEVQKLNPVCHTILLTANQNPDVVAEALNMGVNNYVDKSKPEAFENLRKYVNKAVLKMNLFLVKFKSIIDSSPKIDKMIHDASSSSDTQYPNDQPDS